MIHCCYVMTQSWQLLYEFLKVHEKSYVHCLKKIFLSSVDIYAFLSIDVVKNLLNCLSAGEQRLKTKCRNWVCGIDEDAKQAMTTQELKEIRRKMTSLEEDSKMKIILNASAIVIIILTIVLLVYFG